MDPGSWLGEGPTMMVSMRETERERRGSQMEREERKHERKGSWDRGRTRENEREK